MKNGRRSVVKKEGRKGWKNDGEMKKSKKETQGMKE